MQWFKRWCKNYFELENILIDAITYNDGTIWNKKNTLFTHSFYKIWLSNKIENIVLGELKNDIN